MRNKAVQSFYSSLGIVKVNTKHLKDELLYKLYQKPKRDKHNDIPHHTNYTKNGVHQADLIFVPDDNGFKYALVVADVACNLTDAEPLQSKTNKELLNAIQTIYKRKILSLPTQIITDSGSEFKGMFKDYFNKNGVIVKTADVGRHRQTAVVEAKKKKLEKPSICAKQHRNLKQQNRAQNGQIFYQQSLSR